MVRKGAVAVGGGAVLGFLLLAWAFAGALSGDAGVLVAAGVGCVTSRYSVFTHHLGWF